MRDDHVELLPVLPPLAAYRRDLARLGVGRLSPDDGLWVAAAVALSHLAQAARPDDEQQRDRVTAMLDVAARGLDVPPLDAPERPSAPLIGRARMLAERAEAADAWHFALSVLAIAERALDPDAMDAGRILAQRARIQGKSGAMDDAERSHRRLLRAARRMNEPELIARAYVGLATVSFMRGNYPAVGRWAKRAVVMAQSASLAGIGAIAHQLMMVSVGQRGDFAGALAHAWTAFESASGHPVREAEELLNLAQLLGRMGEHRAALAGFVAALERSPPPRIALPAWGGVATSASHLDERRITRLAAKRIEQVATRPGLQFARASALMEATLALERLHLGATAWRQSAMKLAEEYRFDQIRYELATPAPVPRENDAADTATAQPPEALDQASTTVITAVDALVDVRSSRVLA
jgi:tetratricopeptide (TPR) repeat protein